MKITTYINRVQVATRAITGDASADIEALTQEIDAWFSANPSSVGDVMRSTCPVAGSQMTIETICGAQPYQYAWAPDQYAWAQEHCSLLKTILDATN